MKKFSLSVIALLCIFVMAGCDTKTDNSQPSMQRGYFSEIESEPLWAQGIQSDGQLFQNLNLDGVGDSDDEAFVSIYQYGEFDEKITVLRIRLGTGETMANIFPVYGPYNLLTGRLFSNDKEAIVLETPVPGSNYGAVNIFALDISPVGSDPIPTSTVRMDTTKGIILNSVDELPDGFYGTIRETTRIVDIKDSLLQGLEIHALTGKDDVSETFYWIGDNYGPDDGWGILGSILFHHEFVF